MQLFGNHIPSNSCSANEEITKIEQRKLIF